MEQHLSRATLESSFQASTSSVISLPWEQGVFAEIFGFSTDSAVPQVTRPLLESELPVDSPERIPERPLDPVRGPPPAGAKTFLKHAVSNTARRVRLSDEDIFEQHVQRLELVLSHNPAGSVLGRSFTGLDREGRIERVRLALGGKAPRTLQKRFGQAAKLITWAEKEGLKAFPIDAQVAEEFVRSLLSSGKGHSAVTGAVECFSFLHHVLGVDLDDGALSSPVLQGILRKTRLDRPALKQARTLLVSEVLALEAALVDDSFAVVDRYCIGAFLFALYARARLGDLKVLDAFIVDLLADSEDACGYLEALSLSHKCRGTSNPRGQRLHLVAPAKGLGPRSWGKDFLAVAKECGRDLSELATGEPLLYLPDVCGGFSNIPADTGRFAAWIQDILSGMSAYSGCKISGHSAKSTPLSWVAKNFTDMDVQTILGHHVLVGRRSALTYARDTQAAPVRKMEEVLADIRRGIFLPDATRSGRHITDVPGPAAPDVTPAGGFSQFHVEPHDQLLEGAELGVNSSQGDAAGGIGNDFDDGLQVSDVDDLLNEAREVASRQAHSPISSRGPELWPEEREWYKAALDNGSEPGSASDALAQPNRLAGDGCEKASAEDSSSSSDSSSEASVEEQVQACGDHADDLEHQKIGECKLFRHKGTRMVHLLPAGSSTNRFVCGREFDSSVHQPVYVNVSVRALECKQCHRGKPIRDTGSLCRALDVALKRPRLHS